MNNFSKSVYISLYISALTLVFIHCVMGLFNQGMFSFWLGIAIATWPALFFFIKLFALPTARTSQNLHLILFSAITGTVLAFILATTVVEIQYALVYGLGIGLMGSTLYIYWYSRLDRQHNTGLENGQTLPDFKLKSAQGLNWESQDLSNHPALILFFRGNWCPLCMAQIKEISKSYQLLEKMGVNVYLVSPQPEANTQALAKKFAVNYHFMTDQENKAATLLGIAAKQGTPKGMEVLGYDSDTVLPTAILTDQNGTIIFTDQTDNYRVRPEPDTFIRVFTDHGITA